MDISRIVTKFLVSVNDRKSQLAIDLIRSNPSDKANLVQSNFHGQYETLVWVEETLAKMIRGEESDDD